MYQEEFWNQRDVQVLYRNILMLKMKRDLVLQCFISVLSYKSILCTFLNLLIYSYFTDNPLANPKNRIILTLSLIHI